MKKPRILLGFSHMSDAALSNLCNNVLSSMTKNDYFPAPTPSLDVVSAIVQQFAAARLAAMHRDQIKCAEKNALRTTLQETLTNLANYVTAASMGNRAIMLSSGFPVSSDNSTAPVLGTFKRFSVKQGKNSGELIVEAGTVDNAVSYEYYYGTPDASGNMVWAHVPETKIRVVIDGLQPGKPYTCYVKALAAKNQSVVSDSITKIVF